MRESLLKRVADCFMGKAPGEKTRGRTIQSLRDEFDFWINRPIKKKAPRKIRNSKRRSRLDGQLYAEACEKKFGKYRKEMRNQNA